MVTSFPFRALAAAFSFALAGGCSSGTAPADGTGAMAGDAPEAAVDSRGAPAAAAAAASPLNGEWDVISSFNEAPRAGTMTISPTRFAISVVAFSFDADLSSVSPEVSGLLHGRQGPVTTTHVPKALDLGQIPLDLGGRWTVRGDSAGTCNAELGSGLMTLDCANLSAPMNRWFQSYDYDLGEPLGGGTSTAQRKRKLPSIFNDLGGEWKVLMPWATCAVTFEGNRMDAKCKAIRAVSEPETTLSLEFGDGVATGTSNKGEMSARRR